MLIDYLERLPGPPVLDVASSLSGWVERRFSAASRCPLMGCHPESAAADEGPAFDGRSTFPFGWETWELRSFVLQSSRSTQPRYSTRRGGPTDGKCWATRDCRCSKSILFVSAQMAEGTKTIRIDPRDFIGGPYRRCPKCGQLTSAS